MKAKSIHLLLLSAVLSLGTLGNAQTFQSGSDGSYGPMNITTNTTLDMPPDGIFHCTTITVASVATLKFRRNALNTPVYLLATGDVTINGSIDVTGTTGGQGRGGESGPGGFDGGQPASTGGNPPGDGHGPGRGKGSPIGGGSPGGGSYATKPIFTQAGDGAVYGNAFLVPIVGGSGGGGFAGNPGWGGSGGGGAILIASSTRIVVGNVGALRSTSIPGNGTSSYGGGSGGAIRLVAPIVSGTGSFIVTGSDNYGGSGRIRIDTQDRSGWNFTFTGPMTYGARMFVFPLVTNRLDIVQVADQVIPEGTQSGVSIEMAAGASTNQTVTVQARGFTNNVPISIVVTPDNGSSSNYLAEIVMTNNPSQITVPVVIPAGQASRIHAWTR